MLHSHEFKKILIPLIDPVLAAAHLKLAAALLPPDGTILALGVVRVPEEHSLSEGAEEALRFRAMLEDCKAQFPDKQVELKTLVRVTHRLSEAIAETADQESSDFLWLPWKGYAASQEHHFGATIDRLLDHPPCVMAVARLEGFSEGRRVLLPVRGGPHAELALAVASCLARSSRGEVTVLHCETAFMAADIQEFPYHLFLHELRLHPQVKRFLAVQGDPKHAIVEEAKAHDMVVVGAGGRREPHASFLGPVVERIALKCRKPLLVLKTPRPVTPRPQPASDLRGSPKPLSERVDKWFAENTFHRSEFDDLQKLLDLKRKQQLTVSLGLPALNEAETVGTIIRTIKKHLVDEVPLLDEIVLIDSRSTDNTVAIARDLGIDVHTHQDILSQYGAQCGKGEGLWKSLHVLKGDLIVWIDTDIKNIHPGFVYGILGPLLMEPKIQYVKGFYRRPIAVGDQTYTEGGGRVTELTARPLFNLFFPELSGVIQPLAGEYGGRRKVLEQVPFFVGYGVETGLLIDLFSRFGLQAIAQVDLEERIHRNHPLPALSQMAFAIIQVFIQRLEEKKRIKLMEEVNQNMKLIRHKGTTYALDVKDIRDQERPPMITIPEYTARRQHLSAARNAART